jgi:2,4-diaminopentanoate dehydrogenase
MNDFTRLPMILTAMPAINAIPKVVSTEPGTITYATSRPCRGLVHH